MPYRPIDSNRRGSFRRSGQARSGLGSVSPLIILSLTVVVAFIALSVDVMRTVHACAALQFGSQAAALHAYRMIFSDDGVRRGSAPEDLVFNDLQQAGGASGLPWNLAPAGPKNGVVQTPVQFEQSDITVLSNPNGGDANDFFLQVRARREGNDALTMLFLPAIYAFNSWSGLTPPANANLATPFRVSEVITQPATRIGAGPSRGASSSEPGASFAGFSTFPIGISNKQFLTIAQNASPGAALTIDIVNSKNPNPSPANHVKGSFVNVYGTGGTQYYGDGLGALAISQLNSTMQYFAGSPAGAILNPAVVERGSMLAAFDAGDATFKNQSAGIVSAAARGITPVRFHAIPVLASDPQFNQRNQVVGFARLQLTGILQNATTGDITINAIVGESTPMLNATIGTGLASVPAVDGSAMPAAEAPFLPRAFDPGSNTIGRRLVGIVMSPALSPRQIQGAPL